METRIERFLRTVPVNDTKKFCTSKKEKKSETERGIRRKGGEKNF